MCRSWSPTQLPFCGQPPPPGCHISLRRSVSPPKTHTDLAAHQADVPLAAETLS